jgi:prolyl 4-hydroxylase
MERVDLKKDGPSEFGGTDQPHFIGSWNIKNNDLCTQIINFFEENKTLHRKGAIGSGIDQTKKKTTDIGINPRDLKNDKFKCFNNYMDELHKCFIDYQHQWPFMKSIIKDVDIGSFNVQKYSKGDHFSEVHAERGNPQHSERIFAWMTYLNDVDDGGKTNFTHYGIKIKPVIGKTLIWPAEWTHAHCGEILDNAEKYIITGWMNFPYSKE